MGIFHPCQQGTPSALIRRDHTVNDCLRLLVGSLCLAISLRVETRGQAHLGSKRSAKLLPSARRELGTMVGYDVLQDPVQAEDMFG